MIMTMLNMFEVAYQDARNDVTRVDRRIKALQTSIVACENYIDSNRSDPAEVRETRQELQDLEQDLEQALAARAAAARRADEMCQFFTPQKSR